MLPAGFFAVSKFAPILNGIASKNIQLRLVPEDIIVQLRPVSSAQSSLTE